MWYRFGLLFLLLAACTSEPQFQKIEGLTQGTTFHITYWSEVPVNTKAIEAEVGKVLEDIDKNLSNYRKDSTIELFNANTSTSPQDVGDEIVTLVRVSQTVSQLSQGCFDLTVKPIFELWGFNTDELKIPAQDVIQKTLDQVGMSKLEVVDDTHLQKKQANVTVDVSAVAQGYSVGKISDVLEQFSVENYMVEIGGELKTHGHKPGGQAWVIAVEKPLPGERSIHKVISMPKDKSMSVMTSGTYRHYFDANGQRYSHILDARTGKPVTHNLVAVTVLHENPTIADAWSTALLCLGYQDGLNLANSEKINAIFIRQQDSELLETQSDALRVNNTLTIQ
ncbi:FAD:protein FMN transferase [Methylomonas sp. AM2-LC]|uniref:FAD:protein FMN transferase n=1 Tax=Methylomonas sp. AM2-LC TaxID=3153301 RepID=UPI00326429E9